MLPCKNLLLHVSAYIEQHLGRNSLQSWLAAARGWLFDSVSGPAYIIGSRLYSNWSVRRLWRDYRCVFVGVYQRACTTFARALWIKGQCTRNVPSTNLDEIPLTAIGVTNTTDIKESGVSIHEHLQFNGPIHRKIRAVNCPVPFDLQSVDGGLVANCESNGAGKNADLIPPCISSPDWISFKYRQIDRLYHLQYKNKKRHWCGLTSSEGENYTSARHQSLPVAR